MQQVVTATGRFGATVSFDGWAVTVEKKSRLYGGRGQRSMPLDQVATVIWRPAGVVTDGVLGFTVAGMVAPQPRLGRRTVSALEDPWQVPFRRSQRPQFEAVRAAIAAAQAAQRPMRQFRPVEISWPGQERG